MSGIPQFTIKDNAKGYVRIFVHGCDKTIKFFPAKGRISAYFSLHVLLGGRNYDYLKDYQVPFWSYIQVSIHNEPTNTNAPRTVDGIYLRPSNNKQDGHKVMNLNISCEKFKKKWKEIENYRSIPHKAIIYHYLHHIRNKKTVFLWFFSW